MQNKAFINLQRRNLKRFQSTATVKEIFQGYQPRRKSNTLSKVIQKEQKSEKKLQNQLFKLKVNDKTIRKYHMSIEQLKIKSKNGDNQLEVHNQVLLKQNKYLMNLQIIPEVSDSNIEANQRKLLEYQERTQKIQQQVIKNNQKSRFTGYQKDIKIRSKKSIKESKKENVKENNKITHKNSKQSHNIFNYKKSLFLLTSSKIG